MLSLRSTGQHIEIPVRINLPSLNQLSNKEMISSKPSFYLLNFSWIHLFAMIIITLFIAIISKLCLVDKYTFFYFIHHYSRSLFIFKQKSHSDNKIINRKV